MWRRNSPWYSLKFSSTATPTPTTTPLTLLLFPLPLSFSLSSVCSDCHRLALLPPCMPPWIVHDHFWWIHKTCCILDWDGAVEKTRVMEKRKAISTSAEEGIEKVGGGWSSECVLGWWDAQITRERGERMKVAAIGFAILICGAQMKRAGEHCKWRQDFLWSRVNAGHVIERAAIFEPRPNFPWLAYACSCKCPMQAGGTARNTQDQNKQGSSTAHQSHKEKQEEMQTNP